MALEKPDVVDAVGVEEATGVAVLTIADAWDWTNEREHLLALQSKLNRYLDFIESGEIWKEYPQAVGRDLVIEVVGRFPIPEAGLELLRRAAEVSDNLGVQIRNRHYQWPS